MKLFDFGESPSQNPTHEDRVPEHLRGPPQLVAVRDAPHQRRELRPGAGQQERARELGRHRAPVACVAEVANGGALRLREVHRRFGDELVASEHRLLLEEVLRGVELGNHRHSGGARPDGGDEEVDERDRGLTRRPERL